MTAHDWRQLRLQADAEREFVSKLAAYQKCVAEELAALETLRGVEGERGPDIALRLEWREASARTDSAAWGWRRACEGVLP